MRIILCSYYRYYKNNVGNILRGVIIICFISKFIKFTTYQEQHEINLSVHSIEIDANSLQSSRLIKKNQSSE